MAKWMSRLKRLLKWSTWQEIKWMSRLHVGVDRGARWIRWGATWVKDANFAAWKRWLLKTMKFYNSLDGENGDDGGSDTSSQSE